MDIENRPRRLPSQTVDPRSDHPATSKRAVERLDEATALELLAAAPYGRIVFVRDGEPEIRPMSHIVDDRQVIIRTRLVAAVSDTLAGHSGLRMTYEADDMDIERRLGWSVIVSGTAAPVADPARQAHYKQQLRTMLAGADDTIIAIEPKTVTGIRIVPALAAMPRQGRPAESR